MFGKLADQGPRGPRATYCKTKILKRTFFRLSSLPVLPVNSAPRWDKYAVYNLFFKKQMSVYRYFFASSSFLEHNRASNSRTGLKVYMTDFFYLLD